MAKLTPDPLPYGSVARPIRQDSWAYIVEVHWPSGVVIVVEKPDGWTYLHSIDPDDPPPADAPDADLSSRGVYDIGQRIPKTDRNFTLVTTANLHSNAVVDAMASAAGLVNGEDYDITGPGIPARTTFTYGGGNAGTLDNDATATATGVSVTISSKNWLFQPIAPNGTSQQIDDFFTIVDSGNISVYYEDPDRVFVPDITPPLPTDQGAIDAQIDAFLAEKEALGIPLEWYKVVRTGDFPAYHNDTVPLCFGECNEVFQIMFPERKRSESFILDMAKTTAVEVKQIARGGDRGDGRLIPGYPTSRAVIVKAYKGANLSFDANWHIVATDNGDVLQDPVWTAYADLLTPIDGVEQTLTLTDPVSGVSGTKFDRNGPIPP